MSHSPEAQRILDRLQAVAELGRQRQAGTPGMATAAAWVAPVKAYQALRFERTYADVLDGRVAGGRYARGARFFLAELYGPQDFSARDAQFARVVPTLVKLFPAALVNTVAELAELHALSETLDDAMARQLAGMADSATIVDTAEVATQPNAAGPEGAAPASRSASASPSPPPAAPQVTASAYIRAWQAVGEPQARERQITLTVELMVALERHTRHRVLRMGLRAMRGAAQAAGLGALQHFLESGFDTFGGMGDTRPFQALVAERERALAAALFQAPVNPVTPAAPGPNADPALAALP